MTQLRKMMLEELQRRNFLLVSLSEMPRLGLHVFAPGFRAEAFPIKASDHPCPLMTYKRIGR